MVGGRVVTRRVMLGGSLAGVVGLALGVPEVASASSADEALLVHVAGTIAVLPVPLPAFGEQGAASERATSIRLRAAMSRLTESRRSTLEEGLRVIRPVVSTEDDHETVVRRFGELVTRERSVDGLVAVVAVCVSTLAARFDPGACSGAELWLDYARRFADRTQPSRTRR